MIYFLNVLGSAILDVLCQVWIDVSSLFKKKVFDNRFCGTGQEEPTDIF